MNQSTQSKSTQQTEPIGGSPPTESAPTVGKRKIFHDLKKELSEKDLSSPGAQKLMLDMLLSAESDRDEYKGYVTKYYDAQAKLGVLEERAKTNTTNEVLFGVGVGLGGAIIGLAPLFWTANDSKGPIALVVGLALTIGAGIGRVMHK